MQEKGIDRNQIIGFVLMFALFLGYYFYTKPTAEELEAQKQEQLIAEQNNINSEKENNATALPIQEEVEDLTSNENIKTFSLENNYISFEFSSRGAQLIKAELKNYNAYDEKTEDHEQPLLLIGNNNANFSLNYTDKDGRIVDLSKRNFKAKQEDNKIIFSTQENGGIILYEYELNGDYDLTFNIRSQKFNQISTDKKVDLSFTLNAFSQEKGKSWEQRSTEFYYSLNNLSDVDYTSSDFTADSDESVDWVAFKQQFFSTILEKENGFKNVKLNLEAEEEDSLYSKNFTFFSPITVNNELNESFVWHFLPLDFNILKDYNKDFEEIIPFGWGIFGWINEWIILPTFKFMSTWGLKYGWVVALLTVFIKLITSPIMYRQYKQSAMMKVLKPDMEKIAEKYKGKDDNMKKQQETMKLYRTAGVNPMAGCLPALLQIPIFYALFNFFPNIIDLRGKSFLWATDLTAYDSIVDLPFTIPFYGDHISLFALLYVVTMVIYFRLSGNMMQQPQQEGMPDMRKIMMIMPIFFILFLNSYASALSLYYFVSNAINIGLVFLIKNVFIDEDKIHAKIQENKKKPPKKKKSKWAQKLDEAMKQAQQQQELNKKRKK